MVDTHSMAAGTAELQLNAAACWFNAQSFKAKPLLL
jgi:hypothetical protein